MEYLSDVQLKRCIAWMRLELLDAVGVSYAGAFPEGTELQPLEGM